MVKPLEYVDHSAEADEKFLSQYKGSENFVKLVKIFLSELTPLEDMYSTWTEKLNLDTATGVNLDYWRDILDSDLRPFQDNPRPENDDVFRALLYALIGAYNSDGTARAIQQTLEKVLKADKVFIDDNFDGSFTFEVDNPTFIFGKDLISNIVRIAKPVGVEFLGYTVTNAYGTKTFGFFEDNDENTLGFAVLASADVTTGVWENYHCAAAGEITTNKRIETIVDQGNLSATMSIIQPKTVPGDPIISDAPSVYNDPYAETEIYFTSPINSMPIDVVLSFDGSSWVVATIDGNNPIDAGFDFNMTDYLPDSDLDYYYRIVDTVGNTWVLNQFPDVTNSYATDYESVVSFNGEPWNDQESYAETYGSDPVILDRSIPIFSLDGDKLSIHDGGGYSGLRTESERITLQNFEWCPAAYIPTNYNYQVGNTRTVTIDPDSTIPEVGQILIRRFTGPLMVTGSFKGDSDSNWIRANLTESSRNGDEWTFSFTDCELTTASIYPSVIETLPDNVILFLPQVYIINSNKLNVSSDLAFEKPIVTDNGNSFLISSDTMTFNGQTYAGSKAMTMGYSPCVVTGQESLDYEYEAKIINFLETSSTPGPDKDGEAFVDDIMNEFNGVIGSKIGYELSYYNLPVPPSNPVEVGSLPNFAFQTSGGLGLADGNEIPAAIEPQVNNDFDDSKSIAFYGDETFLSTLESDVISNFNQTNVLTIFDKNNNRFDIERLTASNNSLLQVDNKYAVTPNGLINTTLDWSYTLPEPSEIPSGFSWLTYLSLTPGTEGDFGDGNGIQISSGTLNFTLAYGGTPNRPDQLDKLMEDFLGHVGRELTMVGRTGEVVRIVNLVAGSPSDNVSQNYTIPRFSRNDFFGNNSFDRTECILMVGRLDPTPGQKLLQIFINDVDYTDWFYKRGGTEYTGGISGSPLAYSGFNLGPPNYDDEPYTAFYPQFVANNQLSVAYRNLPEYSNTQETGFLSNRQGVGLVLYDNGLDAINCRTYFNGIKISAASFLSRFSGFNKNESSDFSSSNPSGLKIYDKPASFDNSGSDYVKYPYLFIQDQYNNDGFNENRVLYFDNAGLNIIMNVGDYDDLLLVTQEKFQDNILPGNNICVTDKAGVKWKIEVPDDFVNDSGDGNPYLTFNGRRVVANGGPAFNFDKQGAGYDKVTIYCSGDRSSTPSYWFFNVYRNGVLVPPDVDTGDADEPEWYFTPYGIGDDEIFAQNNPNGLTEELPEQKIQWLIENLSSFDIVNAELINDNYWKIDIDLSSSGVDHVVLFEQGVEQVIMQLSPAQLEGLNINSPTIIPFLIKETSEGDGVIPDEGYSTKGGGRFALLNV